jgi:hypothetical protein
MALENPFQSNDGSYKATNKINGIAALHDHVIVRDMNFGNRTLSSGIIMLNDDAKTDGIRPRWAQVYRVGPDQKHISVGQWIMIEHGRWTRGAKVEINEEEFTIRRVDPSAIIFVSDTEPGSDDTISTAVHAQKKER